MANIYIPAMTPTRVAIVIKLSFTNPILYLLGLY